MFTQAQATELYKLIYKEAPYLDVQIQAEEPPHIHSYYLIVSQKGKLRFVVRDEAQWQERKHLVIS